jgi:hypothetical protein
VKTLPNSQLANTEKRVEAVTMEVAGSYPKGPWLCRNYRFCYYIFQAIQNWNGLPIHLPEYKVYYSDGRSSIAFLRSLAPLILCQSDRSLAVMNEHNSAVTINTVSARFHFMFQICTYI